MASDKSCRESDFEQGMEAVEENIRLCAAMEATNEGVVIINNQERIIYANASFKEKFAIGDMKLVGDKLEAIFLDKNAESILFPIREAMKHREEWSGRLPFKKDGAVFYFDTSLSPIDKQMNDDKGLDYVLVMRDITRGVQLEHYVRRQQKLEAVGTLASGIAHDLNNILVPITVNTELVMLELPEDSKHYYYLQEVINAAHRGKELVRQVISFSRPHEIKRQAVNPVPILRETYKFLRASLPETIKTRYTIKTEKCFIKADPTHIHQILMNVCSNAAHAMQEGGGELAIELQKITFQQQDTEKYPDIKPGNYLMLTISDTGCGMSPEIIDNIFDPFFTTKKEGEGTGMGLSIVHGIVKSYGGAILLYSEPGKGTTMHIIIPLLHQENGDEETSDRDREIPRGNEKILFVDDDPAVVESGKNMLERLGYDVTGITSSIKALELFQENQKYFDLIVTDQTMPDMTGAELVHEIKKTRSDIPVIICTGYASQVNEERIKEIGVQQLLMKPFTTRSLARAVRQTLDYRRYNNRHTT